MLLGEPCSMASLLGVKQGINGTAAAPSSWRSPLALDSERHEEPAVVRDTPKMAQRDYADLFDIATAQGRHLDMLILGMLRFVFLVASAEIVYIVQFQQPIPNIPELALIFFPILAAYLVCASAFFTKTLLAGNPNACTVAHDRDHLEGLEPWQFSQLHASEGNWFRKQVLHWATLFLAIAPVAFADVIASAGTSEDELLTENYWAWGTFGAVALIFVCQAIRVLTHRPRPKHQDIIRAKAVVDLEAKRVDVEKQQSGNEAGTEATNSADGHSAGDSAVACPSKLSCKRLCCSGWSTEMDSRRCLLAAATAAAFGACFCLGRLKRRQHAE